MEKREFRITEEPVHLQIMAENGLCIFSKSFSFIKVNEQILGGFLSAINAVSRELVSSDLDQIKMGKYFLFLKIRSPLSFCYLCKNGSPSVSQLLDHFIQELDRFSLIDILSKFDGRMLETVIWTIIEIIAEKIFVTSNRVNRNS